MKKKVIKIQTEKDVLEATKHIMSFCRDCSELNRSYIEEHVYIAIEQQREVHGDNLELSHIVDALKSTGRGRLVWLASQIG
jgi:hypothetical protein